MPLPLSPFQCRAPVTVQDTSLCLGQLSKRRKRKHSMFVGPLQSTHWPTLAARSASTTPGQAARCFGHGAYVAKAGSNVKSSVPSCWWPSCQNLGARKRNVRAAGNNNGERRPRKSKTLPALRPNMRQAGMRPKWLGWTKMTRSIRSTARHASSHPVQIYRETGEKKTTAYAFAWCILRGPPGRPHIFTPAALGVGSVREQGSGAGSGVSSGNFRSRFRGLLWGRSGDGSEEFPEQVLGSFGAGGAGSRTVVTANFVLRDRRRSLHHYAPN